MLHTHFLVKWPSILILHAWRKHGIFQQQTHIFVNLFVSLVDSPWIPKLCGIKTDRQKFLEFQNLKNQLAKGQSPLQGLEESRHSWLYLAVPWVIKILFVEQPGSGNQWLHVESPV